VKEIIGLDPCNHPEQSPREKDSGGPYDLTVRSSGRANAVRHSAVEPHPIILLTAASAIAVVSRQHGGTVQALFWGGRSESESESA